MTLKILKRAFVVKKKKLDNEKVKLNRHLIL